MQCKMHHDEDGIPKFLCRACNPDKFKATRQVELPSDAPESPWAEKFRKRKVRKLRAEEKRLSTMIDEIGGRDPVARKRAYEAIAIVEKEIAKLES